MKKVLVNTANINRGGALQVACSFIRHVESYIGDEFEFVFVLSKSVQDQLINKDVASKRYVLDKSPAKSIKARRLLKSIEKECSPDLVFTIFGPSYVRFHGCHVCGVADGWVTHSTHLAYSVLVGWRSKLVRLLQSLYRGIWYRRADYWITEAQVAKDGLSSRCFLKESKIFVVPNSYSDLYSEFLERRAALPVSECVNILVLASAYPQKNLSLIPQVVSELRKRGVKNFKFLLTLPHDVSDWLGIVDVAQEVGIDKYIVNLGPLDIAKCIDVYQEAHITFMPTVLETFSAVFPESMAMGVPIVTTEILPNIDVCGDAAIYFKPKDAISAADALCSMMTEKGLYECMVERGKKRLTDFSEADKKVEQYLHILSSLGSKK